MNFYTSAKQVGENIWYRGYENGKPVQYKKRLTPVLYTKTNKVTGLNTLDGSHVEAITFDTIRDSREFVKQYADISDFTVYGFEKFHYVELQKMYPSDIQYDIKCIRIFYIDIETSTEYGFPNIDDPKEEVLCLTIIDSYTGKSISWGTRPIEPQDEYEYILCDGEVDLYDRLTAYWKANMPDVVSGWNSLMFDIPYIFKRISRVMGDAYINAFSPWKKIKTRSVYKFNREHLVYDIVGIAQLDYLDLYKKFTYTNQENYKLDTIAELELGVGKVDHSEYETFKLFYDTNFSKFVAYNRADVQLIVQLEAKLKLIELAIAVAFDAKINFDEVYTQTVAWDSIIFNYLISRNIVVPSKEIHEKEEKFEGAFVKEPTPGMYQDVVSFDLASLYPHIIQLLNISPETKVLGKASDATVDSILDKTFDNSDYLDYSISPTGTLYTNGFTGMMPELMQKYYAERKIYKKKQAQQIPGF